MTDADLLAELFRGSDLAHGQTHYTGQTNAKGKTEVKSWTVPKPADRACFEAHLKGEVGLGIPPIGSSNTVYWGAIDVDSYGLDVVEVNSRIQTAKLPLVLCRSKSGGPHLFLFVKDAIPAKMMMERLEGIAAYLGYGQSEIFPKQAVLGRNEQTIDYGSWINLPYFGGLRYLRYALDAKGEAITSIKDFVDYARSRSLTGVEIENYSAPDPAPALPDGPPCLNRLYEQGVGDFRNVVLANTCVYLRKAHPDDWQNRIEEYNRKFTPPLPAAEVEALRKSYAKKEYRFQCSKPPLSSFCDSSKCKQCKHGIGGRDLLPEARSLTMVATIPPIWYLDITLSNGVTHRISLSTEELQTQRLFQRRCMETLQQMPPVMKTDEWEEIVSGLMRHVTKIEIPPELTPRGQFKGLVMEFLETRAKIDSMEDVLRGVPYKDANFFYFRMKDLDNYLNSQKFIGLKQNERASILTGEMKGARRFVNIRNAGVNVFVLPINEATSPQPLKPTEIKQDL